MEWICTLRPVKDHALLCAFEHRGSYPSLWSSGGQTGQPSEACQQLPRGGTVCLLNIIFYMCNDVISVRNIVS